MLQVRQVLLTAKDRAMPHQPITGIYKSIHTHYNTRSNPWETETNRSSIDVCQNSSDESKTVDQRPSIDSLRGGGVFRVSTLLHKNDFFQAHSCMFKTSKLKIIICAQELATVNSCPLATQ